MFFLQKKTRPRLSKTEKSQYQLHIQKPLSMHINRKIWFISSYNPSIETDSRIYIYILKLADKVFNVAAIACLKI